MKSAIERTRAEEELRSSEESCALTMRGANDGVVGLGSADVTADGAETATQERLLRDHQCDSLDMRFLDLYPLL